MNCQECSKSIDLSKLGISKATKRKFCSLRCCSIHTNRKKSQEAAEKKIECKVCKQLFHPRFYRMKYCSRECVRSTLVRDIGRTKGELYDSKLHDMAARATLTRGARRSFEKSGKQRSCLECGYSTHIEICHVKPVKDFPDTAKISTINDPSNLIALCPTHHWEFDHGILKLDLD